MIKPSDLTVMIVVRLEPMTRIIRTALSAMDVRDIIVVDNVDAVEHAVEHYDPDVMIVLIEGVGKKDPGLSLSRRMRLETSPNRYIPIVAVSFEATVTAVRASINAGIHEFVAAPLSAEMLYKKVMRSIFIGWPFVDTKAYFGPCRRRFVDPSYKGPDRRVADWSDAAQAGYEERKQRVDDMIHI